MKYGRYEIEKELGKGAMGVVYQAHDPEINRRVALKVLRPDRVTSEDFARRFQKEAQAIGRLSHPHIVTVYDVGHDHDTIYIAMEFLDGRPMDEVFKETPPDLDDIRSVGIQVARTLDYAHGQGIVHRDIKPSNIMLTAAGEVKITDFGIARIEDPSAPQLTQAGEILGTPIYMSPEQVKGQTVDGRSDLYSLGVILYELSTGHRPFSGKNMAAIFHAITSQAPENPMAAEPFVSSGATPALSALILKSLEKSPENRFQTGESMAKALEASQDGDGEETIVLSRAEKTKKTGLFAAIAIFIILTTAGFIWYLSSRPESGPPESQPSALNVTSNPTGAQVYLNGDYTGNTPLKIDLTTGKYEVRVSLTDYYAWEAQVQLKEAKEMPLYVRLIPREE